MRVWIDQDLCTGDGLCTDHAPTVFVLLEDGISYVQEAGAVLNDPGGAGSVATVFPRDERAVLVAADDCPGECIFVEDDPPDPDPAGTAEEVEIVVIADDESTVG
jgi:ferredoxin